MFASTLMNVNEYYETLLRVHDLKKKRLRSNLRQYTRSNNDDVIFEKLCHSKKKCFLLCTT